MSHGIFEELESSASEIKTASKASQQKLAAAIFDVKEKYGDFLYGATALDEFHDRVALVKNDMIKTVDAAGVLPVTGVMRRVVKACKDEWRKTAGQHDFSEQHYRDVDGFVNEYGDPGEVHVKHPPKLLREWDGPRGAMEEDFGPPPIEPGRHRASRHADKTGPAMHVDNTFTPSHGDLVPDGDFKGYLDSVDQGAESKISDRFEGGDVQRHEKDPANSDFVKDSYRRQAGNPHPVGDPAWFRWEDGEGDPASYGPKGSGAPGGGIPLRGPLSPEQDAWMNKGRGKHSSLALQVFSDWCQSEGLRTASIDSLDKYAENLSDEQYFKLAAELQRTALGIGDIGGMAGSLGGMAGGLGGVGNMADFGGMLGGMGDLAQQGVGMISGLAGGAGGAPPGQGGQAPGPTNDLAGAPSGVTKGGSRRIAKGSTDYLQKADEALTNLLNQKAEEFQESVQALQQALQTVQQAEQAQAAMNPMGVQPPAGTVNLLPGQDAAAAGGMPSGGDMSSAAGGAAGGMPPQDPTQMMASRHSLDEPGECKGGEDSDPPGQSAKTTTKDWHSRDKNQRWVSKGGKRQGGAAPFA